MNNINLIIAIVVCLINYIWSYKYLKNNRKASSSSINYSDYINKKVYYFNIVSVFLVVVLTIRLIFDI